MIYNIAIILFVTYVGIIILKMIDFVEEQIEKIQARLDDIENNSDAD